jgi:REP element-mobilizing transposase RayT
MEFDPKYDRHSIRLKDYDYTTPGGYFITICVQDRACILGNVRGEGVELSDIGKIVEESWNAIPNHFLHITLDSIVIMPNHFHGIIIIDDTRFDGRGEVPSPSQESITIRGGETPPLRKPSFGQVVAYFKYLSTKRVNQLLHIPPKRLWQRNYYEHIIRDERDHYNARKYILENPLKWQQDEFYYNSR